MRTPDCSLGSSSPGVVLFPGATNSDKFVIKSELYLSRAENRVLTFNEAGAELLFPLRVVAGCGPGTRPPRTLGPFLSAGLGLQW